MLIVYLGILDSSSIQSVFTKVRQKVGFFSFNGGFSDDDRGFCGGYGGCIAFYRRISISYPYDCPLLHLAFLVLMGVFRMTDAQFSELMIKLASMQTDGGPLITTANGAIQVVYRITLGDFAVVTAVGLLIILVILQWILGSVWRFNR
jgi:hypothetical protein